MLHLQFLFNLCGAKKSCKDSQVSTRDLHVDCFHPVYGIEICSGLLMVTHISDALTCYNALNFPVSQLLEP